MNDSTTGGIDPQREGVFRRNPTFQSIVRGALNPQRTRNGPLPQPSVQKYTASASYSDRSRHLSDYHPTSRPQGRGLTLVGPVSLGQNKRPWGRP